MSREVSEKGMPLGDFLLFHTEIYTPVWIMEEKEGKGLFLGATYIDPEDAFIHSLHPELLERRVNDYFFMPQSWSRRPVLTIYVT